MNLVLRCSAWAYYSIQYMIAEIHVSGIVKGEGHSRNSVIFEIAK